MSDDVQELTTPAELYEALLEEKRAAKEAGPRPVVSTATSTSSYIQLPVTERTVLASNDLIEGFVKDGAIRREGSTLVVMRA